MMGRERADALLVEGRKIDAATAKEWGSLLLTVEC
jgi:enoyl-CoA hydratase/carnithine racemase